MYTHLNSIIEELNVSSIPKNRLEILQPLIDYIQNKTDRSEIINLNFICTHNSRRSHLSQIWAQTMAAFFNVNNVYCYSGGTESTALFPMVSKILKNQGFLVKTLSDDSNPIYTIKYAANNYPVICFSKTFDDDFNPKSEYAAIMTCSHANENCPTVYGCEKRIPITYEDPKAFDSSPQQAEKYKERSMQIASELKYVFSKINQNQ